MAELDLDTLLAHAHMTPTLEPISPMPPLREDLAFVVEQTVGADEVEMTIRKAAGPLLADVTLFDVYRGEQIGAGNISLAYRLTLQAPDRTLTSKESERVRTRIVKAIAKELGGKLRT